MTSVEPPGAEGGGVNSRTQLYTGSDEEGEEDSSILADLASMFPVVAHDELVTVLRSHHGDVDATVDYLMALSLQRDSGGASLPPDFLQEGFVEEDERQFSSEIGGLPEVLPSFMTGGQTDSESDDEIEEDAPANRVRSGSRHVNSDEDPLPSYEEAVMDEGYIVAGSIMLPTTTSREMLIEGQSSGSSCLPHPHAQKKKRKQKLRKLAGKLSMKRNRSTDYKATQERSTGVLECHPLLQPLAKGDELEAEKSSVTS